MDEMQLMLQQLAKKNGMTTDQVLQEMEAAIDAGWSNPDPAVQAAWKKLPFDGKPSVSEFILLLAKTGGDPFRSKE